MTSSEIESLILLCLVVAPVPLVIIRLLFHAPRMKSSNRCPQCRRDRSDLTSDMPCPRCKSMPGILGFGKGSKSDVVACRRCGHSLEGLQWNAACPECGLAQAALPKFIYKRGKLHFTQRIGISILLAIWCIALMLLLFKTF